MGYSQEIIGRARLRLDDARMRREKEARDRLDRVYNEVPRVKEIDRETRLVMTQAAREVLLGGNPDEVMTRARERNEALRRERQEILDSIYGVGFLDEEPVCKKCGGSGYLGSTMCSCLQVLCDQEQKKDLTILFSGEDDFNKFRLDYYPDIRDPKLHGRTCRETMSRTFSTCKAYAYDFSMNSKSLLFTGNSGLGKTFLSACIARVVSERGYSVVYESAGKMFSVFEAARFKSDEESRRTVQKYTTCDLLIVDDLGTEMAGQFVTATLYTLLNDRILEGKPMIISTNLTKSDLVQRYSIQIMSRLWGTFIRLTFVGDDIRLKENFGVTNNEVHSYGRVSKEWSGGFYF